MSATGIRTDEFSISEDLKHFLNTAASVLDWGELENEIVMDIGCGIGYSALKLLEVFPKVGQVVAIDQASDLIETASNNNHPKKISFYTADIQIPETISQWTDDISKIICIDCINWVRHLERAFFGMYSLLKSGGSALILFSINSPFQDALKVLRCGNWKDTALNAETLFPRYQDDKLTLGEYTDLLEDAGFQIVYTEEFDREFVFKDQSDFIDKAENFLTPYFTSDSDSFNIKLREDFLAVYVRQNGMEPNFTPKIKSRTVFILISKP